MSDNRSPLEVPIATIIALDPQMGGKTKAGRDLPALALCEWADGTIEFVSAVKKKVRTRDTLSHRIDMWESAVRELHDKIVSRKDWPRPAVACESARGTGGSGYALQAMRHHIKDVCRPPDENPGQWPQAMGLRFFSVNPSAMKSSVTGSGSASKAQVADIVHMAVYRADELPPGDDWTDAAGIGLTGLEMLRTALLIECANGD